MKTFQITTSSGLILRFNYYYDAAPQTCAAFEKSLPFTKTFFHARVSGFEIWIDDAPKLNIPQENASVFAEAGEIVIGPMQPSRNKIIGCIGIFYGEGKLVDCGNIFGKVFDEDLPILKALGDEIWRKGGQELTFDRQ